MSCAWAFITFFRSFTSQQRMALVGLKFVQNLILVILFINVYILVVLNINDVIVQDAVTRSRLKLNRTFTSRFDGEVPIGDEHCLDYQQIGTLFQAGKEILLDGNVKLCFLMSFSPLVEEGIFLRSL